MSVVFSDTCAPVVIAVCSRTSVGGGGGGGGSGAFGSAGAVAVFGAAFFFGPGFAGVCASRPALSESTVMRMKARLPLRSCMTTSFRSVKPGVDWIRTGPGCRKTDPAELDGSVFPLCVKRLEPGSRTAWRSVPGWRVAEFWRGRWLKAARGRRPPAALPTPRRGPRPMARAEGVARGHQGQQLLLVARRQRPGRVERGQLEEAVRHDRPPPPDASSARFSVCMPVRIRVFTVPSGRSKRSASSDCV